MKRNPNSPTNLGGERFWPLTPDERRAFHQSAKEADDPLEELTGLTLLHGGMRNTTYHHMLDDWLEYDGEGRLQIAVPYSEVCVGGVGETGQNNEAGANLHERGEPCYRCRDSTPGWVANDMDVEDYHDEKWYPKTEARAESPIPIEFFNEHTAELLEWWFDQNDQIPLLHSAVNDRIKSIAERAGIEREVTAHDLRNTFGTHKARNDVSKQMTASWMGHSSSEVTETFYIFVGANLDDDLAEKLDEDLDNGG